MGASFLFLAYPNSNNAMMRAEFWLAICRFAVSAMCEKDRDWANSPQAIRPIISLIGDTDRRKALRLGSTQLGYRFKAATFFAWPHLFAEFRECELVKYQGFAPTVENLAVMAKHRMGWDRDRDGTSTIKSRIWGPSRPVIHAAAMLLAYGNARGISIRNSGIVVALSEGSRASSTRTSCIGICATSFAAYQTIQNQRNRHHRVFALNSLFDPILSPQA